MRTIKSACSKTSSCRVATRDARQTQPRRSELPSAFVLWARREASLEMFVTQHETAFAPERVVYLYRSASEARPVVRARKAHDSWTNGVHTRRASPRIAFCIAARARSVCTELDFAISYSKCSLCDLYTVLHCGVRPEPFSSERQVR